MAPDVDALVRDHLRGARFLPFILLTDAQGRWLAGGGGATTPEKLRRLLESAVQPSP
jgi:hypothetical protein